MARFFKLFSLLSLFLFTACQEGGDAGDLWGQWRMVGADHKYVSFSGAVALFRDTTIGDVYGNFQHVGDSLFIQCYSVKGEQVDTIMVEERFGFKPFNDIRVKIVTVDGDRLVLSKDSNTWSFYKY